MRDSVSGTGWLLTITVGAAMAPAVWSAEFTVDASSIGKRVFPLNGVIAGPGHMKHLPGRTYTRQYQAMGIPLVRTHDYYGPCDLSTIFPSAASGWTGDPSDPASYDFTETDAVINEIEAAGCDVMFRLGESWIKGQPCEEMPPDFSKVAEVCWHIVAHHGGGECGPYNCRIRLWEIWNEPNLDMFWPVDADEGCEQFRAMYVEIAKALRAEFPWIRIGGPGAKGESISDQQEFAKKLAVACMEADAPLDFYSWHYFNGDRKGPYIFAKHAQAIRETLNTAGKAYGRAQIDPGEQRSMAKTLNVLGGWNTSTCNPGGDAETDEDRYWKATLGDINGAAYSTAMLTYLHLYTDVRYACRCRGDYWQPEDGYGMITRRGKLKKPGYGFMAYSGLFPQRGQRRMFLLAGEGGDTGNQGEDKRCRAIMATIDQARTVVNVLISLWEHGPEGFKLTVDHLPDGWQDPMVEYSVVSAQHDCECQREDSIAQQYLQDRGYSITVKQVPDTTSSIHLVRLYDATRFPTLRPTGVAPAEQPRRPGRRFGPRRRPP